MNLKAGHITNERSAGIVVYFFITNIHLNLCTFHRMFSGFRGMATKDVLHIKSFEKDTTVSVIFEYAAESETR